MKKFLNSYSIMPLDTDNLDAICSDIKEQYESGVATCALFSMTLVPEGTPPDDKAEKMCKKYAKFKEKLTEMGLKSGVLVQASVGHGWILGAPFSYQKHKRFDTGKEVDSVCPYDTGFQEYIYKVMRTIAMQDPECIMLDDDFRTIWFKGEGCACPLHMKRFNELAGTALTYEELYKIITEENENTKKYTDIFIEVQKESLINTAKIMRAGIDSVNPKLPASYCCCGNNAEFAYEIASILAGESNPVTVRINNGNYTPLSARNISRAFHRAATQIEKLKGKVDVILAETDTCPQNRYSTSASSLHSHFTGSILEGANGAKHWITRLICHEPKSGEAYRKILGKHSGFYNELAALQPTLKYHGCRIFTPNTPDFTYSRVREEWDAWSNCVLERLGLPIYFSSEHGGALFLEGDVDSRMSDEYIKKALSGTLILASDTAKNLENRGFSQYTGVSVKEWTGKNIVVEKIIKSGATTKPQMKNKQLIPSSPDACVLSYAMNTTNNEEYTPLFPASTVFKNELGGTVVVFSGTPVAEFDISQAFSFLNYSRKEQLIDILKQTGNLPVYYVGDEEVYLKSAETENGEEFVALFNIGLDLIEEIKLSTAFDPKGVKMLMPNGEKKEVSFTKEGEIIRLNLSAQTLMPVILFIEK